jgi:5-methylthioadenosine/S-adenosylhomocysteine deaminase
MQSVDALIRPRWTIRVEPGVAVEQGLAVAVDDGRIVAVVPVDEAERRFNPGARHDRPRHVLLPGLVNVHTSAATSLFRGLAGDRLPTDLRGAQTESRWLGSELVADGTRLAIAEMLLGGITCFADMYDYPDVAGDVAAETGIRAVLGMVVREASTAWARDADDCIRKGLEVHDRFKGDPLIRTAFAPWAPNEVTDATLVRIRQLADELDLPIQTRLHETAADVDASVARFGQRPLARLRAQGLVTPALIGVHATQLEDAEIELLAIAGASVAHCPRSNLKLASGACPVAVLRRAGVNVALGTDGADRSDRLDLWAELQTSALLAKHVAADPTAVSAATALEMATLAGARALNLEREIGSVAAGKAADLICVDLGRLALQPILDPLSRLVYAASSHDVTDVWVAGAHLVANRELVRLDAGAIGAAAEQWGRRFAAAQGDG